MENKLKWKNEVPTEDGFYWQNEYGKVSLVAITASCRYGGVLTFGNPGSDKSIAELIEHGMEWCGPVSVTPYPPLSEDSPVYQGETFIPYYGGTYRQSVELTQHNNKAR